MDFGLVLIIQTRKYAYTSQKINSYQSEGAS